MLVDWVDMRPRFPFAILVLALTLAPLAAPLLAPSHPVAALLIRNFFSRLCHQDPSRSFFLDGSAVAVCVRCLGIYWGAALGMVVRLRRPRWLLAGALVVNLADVADRLAASHMPVATPAFEFRRWTASLNSREQELMRLRFIEQWEYHEIAAAHAAPIGTVLWRVFNAQKKLAGYLKTRRNDNRKAA